MLVYWPTRESFDGGSVERRLPEARADHVMLPWRDKVLVCGGWRESAEGDRTPVGTVDVYEPEGNVWSVETSLPTPR